MEESSAELEKVFCKNEQLARSAITGFGESEMSDSLVGSRTLRLPGSDMVSVRKDGYGEAASGQSSAL